MSRASKSEPTTRAGIIAAGLVRIVKTPAELDAEGGWWTPEKPHTYPDDVKRARAEGLRSGPPKWLRPPVTPKQAVARMFRDAEAERKAACKYLGGNPHTPPSQMSPTQLRAALGVQLRRLSGWGADKSLDVTVAPADPTQAEAIPEPVTAKPKAPRKARRPRQPRQRPEPALTVTVAAPTPAEPTPEPVSAEADAPSPDAAAEEYSPEWSAAWAEGDMDPEPTPVAPAPEPPVQRKARGRGRLAWVPVMQRLAEMYAARGLPTPPPTRRAP